MSAPPTNDDAELLESWRAGDRTAGDELVRRYFLPVRRFFMTHPGVDADELTQRTFAACVAARDRDYGSFGAYLFGIARNQLLREFTARRVAGERAPEVAQEIAALVTSPSMRVARLDLQQLFVRGLAALPREFALVLEQFYWDDRSIPEIASALGIAVGTVKSRLFRGKALLRDWLAAAKEPEELRTGTMALLERPEPVD